MSDPGRFTDPPTDAVDQNSHASDRHTRSRGKFWIILIAAMSLGSIGCMCAFVFLAVA